MRHAVRPSVRPPSPSLSHSKRLLSLSRLLAKRNERFPPGRVCSVRFVPLSGRPFRLFRCRRNLLLLLRLRRFRRSQTTPHAYAGHTQTHTKPREHTDTHAAERTDRSNRRSPMDTPNEPNVPNERMERTNGTAARRAPRAYKSSSSSGSGTAEAFVSSSSYCATVLASMVTSGGLSAGDSTNARLGSPTSLRASHRKGFSKL